MRESRRSKKRPVDSSTQGVQQNTSDVCAHARTRTHRGHTHTHTRTGTHTHTRTDAHTGAHESAARTAMRKKAIHAGALRIKVLKNCYTHAK